MLWYISIYNTSLLYCLRWRSSYSWGLKTYVDYTILDKLHRTKSACTMVFGYHIISTNRHKLRWWILYAYLLMCSFKTICKDFYLSPCQSLSCEAFKQLKRNFSYSEPPVMTFISIFIFQPHYVHQDTPIYLFHDCLISRLQNDEHFLRQ